MILRLMCLFVALFFLLDRSDPHLTGIGFDSEVDAIVDGDAVQHAGVCHRKFHLHRGHQPLDVTMIDLDCRPLRIQTLHDSNTMI